MSVTVGADMNITCTFENSKIPLLTVTKVVVNDNGGTLSSSDFTINVSGNNPNDVLCRQ
ncbi:MAG: hypothetical protein R3F53_15710 [Gammaproteobacteria bacterium]